MRDDYLWDRTGDPDPEIEGMERLLARYRYSAPGGRKTGHVTAPAHRFRTAALIAVAASLAAIALASRLLKQRQANPPASQWRMSAQGCAPRLLAQGETVETDSRTTARLGARLIGELRLEPNSRLQILRSAGGEQRLALHRGAIHALIWAPPQRFVVDTPSAAAVDLGCEYTLHVEADGSGLVMVERGWVAFQAGSVESFIPAGAACRTRPQRGPGVPYFRDASELFRNALGAFEETGSREALDSLLAKARKRDALTLWHLVIRTPGPGRDRVVSRLAELVPGVNPAGLEHADPAALDAAWNALGLGKTEWWRTWKQKW